MIRDLSLHNPVASNGDDLRENTPAYRGFQRVFHDEVYLVSDDAAQFLFQPDKGEQPWGFAEFNENINVAVFFLLSPHIGSKHTQGSDFVLVLQHGEIFPQPLKDWKYVVGWRPGVSWTIRIPLYRSTHQNTWYLLFDLELINHYDSGRIIPWENLQITSRR